MAGVLTGLLPLCQSILEVSDHAQGSGEQMGTGAALGVSGGLAEEAA